MFFECQISSLLHLITPRHNIGKQIPIFQKKSRCLKNAPGLLPGCSGQKCKKTKQKHCFKSIVQFWRSRVAPGLEWVSELKIQNYLILTRIFTRRCVKAGRYRKFAAWPEVSHLHKEFHPRVSVLLDHWGVFSTTKVNVVSCRSLEYDPHAMM